jgi:hypothetical protein
MVVKENGINLWKNATSVSAAFMPTIGWLWQLIGFLMQKLSQKEKWRVSGPMPGAILAKVASVTQFPCQPLVVSAGRFDSRMRITLGRSPHLPVPFYSSVTARSTQDCA